MSKGFKQKSYDPAKVLITFNPTPVWTTQPPTKPGWYWARPVREVGPANQVVTERTRQVVHVVEHPMSEKTPLAVYVDGWDSHCDLEDFDLWAGPLEAPPLPESGEVR